MSQFLFLLLFVPLSLGLAARAATNKSDRGYLLLVVTLAWLLLGTLVLAINGWMPFADGGDDWDYYQLGSWSASSLDELMDLTRFSGVIEQPGYAWLLSGIGTLFGHELLIYKWLNLFLLILLALTWYRIGARLETPRFGRRLLMLILLLTPLWYYVFFLLKDMTITLLQSFTLWATIELWYGNKLFTSAGRFFLTSFAVLLFRSALFLQNIAVLAGALVFRSFGRKASRGWGLSIFLLLILVIVIVPVVTSESSMSMLGIGSKDRVIGSQEMLEYVQLYKEYSGMNRELFLLLYLFSETSGLSVNTWAQLGSAWVRGVLALPWIFFLVPFFLLGVLYMFQALPNTPKALGMFGNLRQSRVMTTPWSAVFLFVASSAAISWIVGDSTRWRIPDMPMVAAIALLGWTYSPALMRRQVLVIWVTVVSVFFSLYYLLRG